MSPRAVRTNELGARERTVLIASEAGVERRRDSLIIDRKFHEGMLEYAKRLDRPLACIVPSGTPGMGSIELEVAEIPYAVHVVPRNAPRRERSRIVRGAVERAALAYLGVSGAVCTAVVDACLELGVKYVAISECTLRTEIDIMRAGTESAWRRLIREFRIRMRHRRKLEIVAGAAELHANGYPTFHELAVANPRRLLYFDTRARAADVVSSPDLSHRLASMPSRPARMIYSGRFIPIKGVVDVVKVGIELHRLGLRFQLDMYGAGPLKQRMTELVESSGTSGTIRIHDPVPYDPDLVAITKDADLFLCCHVQGDPSCTYLETFACGVPILGYANEMWSFMCEASKGGAAVPVGDHRAMAARAMELLSDRDRLEAASMRAREFALAHTMESAWGDRTSRLAAILRADEEDGASRRGR